ncbi:hypothetical protein HYX13_02495 [Candidatus Woesearchaeota archaeon]|nr:hypothetical protein [Candidatus Woesearchaeota archaeon]
MSLYEQSWWKRIFAGKNKPRKTDAGSDITAIKEFLQDLQQEIPLLNRELEQLEELEKERSVASEGVLQVNLETQGKFFDKIFERYEFFENDTSINGIRLQRLGKHFLEHAKKAGLVDLVHLKKKDHRWKFNW